MFFNVKISKLGMFFFFSKSNFAQDLTRFGMVLKIKDFFSYVFCILKTILVNDDREENLH